MKNSSREPTLSRCMMQITLQLKCEIILGGGILLHMDLGGDSKLHKWISYGSASTYWEKLDSDLLFGLPTYQLWSLKIETNSIQIPILPVIWQMSQNWDKICVLYLLGDPTRTIDICSFGYVVTNFMVHTKWKAMFPTYPMTYKIPEILYLLPLHILLVSNRLSKLQPKPSCFEPRHHQLGP